MVRASSVPRTWLRCSPHPRGDGPNNMVRTKTGKRFSPPAWGWSAGRACDEGWRAVLPTRVGMVRRGRCRIASARSSPHPRGDGPPSAGSRDFFAVFSPPAWGWSEERIPRHHFAKVLPTRVGMVRARHRIAQHLFSSPHPRGDGPPVQVEAQKPWRFSPPAWGWSGLIYVEVQPTGVLPTRVGMVRRWFLIFTICAGSPHPRGDGP